VWGSQEHSVPRAQQVKFRPSLLVLGGTTARGLTKLHIIPQKTSVDSNYYISEILEKEVKSAFSRTKISTDLTATKLFSRNCDGLFQQDGALAHTSRATITWLDKNIGQFHQKTGPRIRQICLQLKTFVDYGHNTTQHNSLCSSRATNTESTRVSTLQCPEINFCDNSSESC